MSELLVPLFGAATPFAWQRELARRLAAGDPPQWIDLPTGAGKTFAVLRAWLAALSEQPARVPRRLVYVVDRRAVADQVYEDARALATTVAAEPLRSRLIGAVPGSDPEAPLAVYAFRGGKTLDDLWDIEPAQPAILAGTVDMLGSRLLFRAYVGAARRSASNRITRLVWRSSAGRR